MLNTHSDRLDYRELLSPPLGYKTAFAMGTTYSLDLETLMAVCAIIGLNVEADTELAESPLHMLEALRRAGDKLLIFCQGGQIKLPDKLNKLLPLLENSVCEVTLKNKKSFHPKTWFLKFSAKDKPSKYRLVVLSRNLTFDRSWDVAVRLDSAGTDKEAIVNGENAGTALKEFILWLYENTTTHNKTLRNKRKQLTVLAEEFSEASFQSPGKGFDSFDFIPFGIGSSAPHNLRDKFHKMFVISPFLSKSVIADFAEHRLIAPDCTLITRKSELPKLNQELLAAFETYTVKDDVVDGEERISESGDAKAQDIHAKVYLRTKGADSDLYIGSANASYNAFYGGNVECLVRLHAKQRYLSVEKLKKDLFGNDEKNNPFESVEVKQYTLAAEETELLERLDHAVQEFCSLPKSAVVQGDGSYTVTVTIPNFTSDVILTLSPLMKSDSKKVSNNVVFSGLALCGLSEWYSISARVKDRQISRVVKIPTEGIPDSRNSAIFSSIIEDKNAFLTYMAFLLSDDFLSAFLESLQKGKGDYKFLNMSYDTPILYERMLKVAAASPESLRDIREIISLIDTKIVPKDFIQLYERFERAVKL